MVDPDVPVLFPHSHNPQAVFVAESGLSAITVFYTKTLSSLSKKIEGKIRHNQIDNAFKPILNINNIIFSKKIKLDAMISELEKQHAPQKRKDGTLLKNPCSKSFKWQHTVE